MTRYRTSLPEVEIGDPARKPGWTKVKCASAPGTPETQAALNFVLAVDDGREPDPETMATICRAFRRVLAGEPNVFVLTKPGRPASSGFTKGDIVSAWIERYRREILPTHPRNALATAQKAAMDAFPELGGKDLEREIDRLWSQGRGTVEGWRDEDLDALLTPHEVPPVTRS